MDLLASQEKKFLVIDGRLILMMGILLQGHDYNNWNKVIIALFTNGAYDMEKVWWTD